MELDLNFDRTSRALDGRPPGGSAFNQAVRLMRALLTSALLTRALLMYALFMRALLRDQKNI